MLIKSLLTSISLTLGLSCAFLPAWAMEDREIPTATTLAIKCVRDITSTDPMQRLPVARTSLKQFQNAEERHRRKAGDLGDCLLTTQPLGNLRLNPASANAAGEAPVNREEIEQNLIHHNLQARRISDEAQGTKTLIRIYRCREISGNLFSYGVWTFKATLALIVMDLGRRYVQAWLERSN